MDADARTPTEDFWSDSGIEEMRRQALRDIAVALLIVALAATPTLPTVFGDVNSSTVATVFGLFLVSVSVYLLSGRSSVAAAVMLCLGFTAVLVLALTYAPASTILPWFATLVLLVGFLVGPGAGVALAAIGTVILATEFPTSGLGFSPGTRLSLSLLLWAASGLSWLALRPLLTALHWSWKNYLEVRQMNQLLKDHRGELARTVKSLNETLDRLDQVNQELERARRAANQARQLKSEFAVNVSHELRTPLNLIIGFSEMMVTSPQSYGGEPLPPAYREDAIAIYRNARHLSDLVDDILDLSQIEAGHMGLHREFISLAAAIDEAVGTVCVLYSQRNLSLQSIVPPDLPPVFADRTRLRQIVINLLSNAVKYIDHGGAVVEVSIDNRDFIIRVADTGCGIAPEDLPHVFDEFWQSPDSHRSGGSGVGLAVSKRFVEMHGGSIWVESVVGKGTTFTFTIPRLVNLPEMPPPTPWETWAKLRGAVPGQPAVALVTQDADTVHLFERYLDDYAVIPLPDITALTVFPSRADLDGVVVVAPDCATAQRRALAAQLRVPHIPFIACGLVNTEGSLAERLGISDHIAKPLSRERLVQVLQRLGKTVRSILIVDDDPDALRLLSRMIRSISRRYQIVTASSGAQALRLMENSRPSAVFLDLVMPDIDGYTLIETIKSHPELGGIPVVAVSAYSLSKRPLTSDGVVFLRAEGLSAGCLIECVRHGLRLLPRTEPPGDIHPSIELPSSPTALPLQE